MDNDVEEVENNNISNEHADSNKSKKINVRKTILFLIVIFIAIVFIYFCFFYKKSIETVKDSTVKIEIYNKYGEVISTGSGFCLLESNYIVTNYHVIEGAYDIKIIDDNKKSYNVNSVIITNPNQDIAIIEGDFNLSPLKIGTTQNLKAGDNIVAIGSPKGELNTVSTGVISNCDDEYEIRITAPISPGSSGGALLDKNNNVIGIIFATYDAEDSQNLNYAIKIDYLKEMYKHFNNNSFIKVSADNDTMDFPTHGFYSISTSSNYYQFSNLSELYKTTSFYGQFEYLIKQEAIEYTETYNNMSEETKKEVGEVIEYLYSNNYKNVDIAKGICNNNITYVDLFAKLEIFQKYELALFISEYNGVNSSEEKMRIVEKYCKNSMKKNFVNCMYGNYSLQALSADDIQSLLTFINLKEHKQLISSEEEVAILEYIGYTVTY